MLDLQDAHERDRFVEDLLSYMTLEEKLGQLDMFHSSADPGLERLVAGGRVGGVCGVGVSARLQTIATERARLGIPLLLIRSSFPLPLSPWALVASWDKDLARTIGARAAREAIGDGFNCLAGPDVGETAHGALSASHIADCEPYLAAQLASAFAQGAGQANADRRSAVLAMPAWRSALDKASIEWSLSLVRNSDVAAIDCAGLDPSTAQRAGFPGLLVAECRRISALVGRHFHANSTRSQLESAEKIVASGLVSELEIDIAVRGVLAAKHGLGLFREPHRIVAPPVASGGGRDDELARRAFVLLRNEAGILPLSPVSDKVLVIGSADGLGSACANALGRAGIGYSLAPGLAQRRDGEPWDVAAVGDPFAASLASDAARRADFVLVALEDRHFVKALDGAWRQPSAITLAMLRGLALAGTRMVAILATSEPVDLSAADQYFAGVLQCWLPGDGFEEALSDVLSGRFSPQGRMPATSGRFSAGDGLGFGESVLSSFSLTPSSQHIVASVKVRNSGAFAMRETVQLYSRNLNGDLRLVAFEHVFLKPGEDRIVTIALGVEAVGRMGANNSWELAPGRHEILLGKGRSRLLPAAIEISPALARAMLLRDPGDLRLATG